MLRAQVPDAAPREPVLRAEPPPPARPVGERRSAPQIVFEAPGVPGSNDIQEISTMNLDGSELRQITRDGLNKFLPHFSPDGTRLVYSKFYSGRYGDMNPETDIAIYDFAEDAETRLTFTGQSFAAAWSPDGTRIAFGTYWGNRPLDHGRRRLEHPPRRRAERRRRRPALERHRLVERRLDRLHRRADGQRLLQRSPGRDPSRRLGPDEGHRRRPVLHASRTRAERRRRSRDQRRRKDDLQLPRIPVPSTRISGAGRAQGCTRSRATRGRPERSKRT